MVPNEKKELDQIGFLWEELRNEENIKKISFNKRKEFNEMVAGLKEYKQIHGDCNVPHKYPANPKLVTLVRRMVSILIFLITLPSWETLHMGI